jgi:FkbM family methyltransferase
MPEATVKTLTLNAKQRTLRGISDEDPYFKTVTDGFESAFALFCKRYVRPDYVCMDIGANIGVTSLILSDYCPNGKLVAVEPCRSAYEALEHNLDENGLKNIVRVRAAIGDKNGRTRFREDSAYGYFSETGAEVEVITISALAKKLKLKALDFVKIDIEGFEPIILRHSLEFLNKNRTLVYLEFNSWCLIVQSRTNPVDYLEWMFENFAHIYVMTADASQLLRPIGRDEIASFLLQNLQSGFVNDLVITNDAERLAKWGPQPAELPPAVGSGA